MTKIVRYVIPSEARDLRGGITGGAKRIRRVHCVCRLQDDGSPRFLAAARNDKDRAICHPERSEGSQRWNNRRRQTHKTRPLRLPTAARRKSEIPRRRSE